MTQTARTAGHLGLDGEEVPDAYFVRLDATRFRSTLHSQGAWNDHEQHMGAASGLLAHALETNHPREDMVAVRFSYDILGLIPGGEVEVTTRVVRPGRTIELLEAVMSHGGRSCIRLSTWRLARGETAALAGTHREPLPPVAQAPAADMRSRWPGGYIASLEGRSVVGHRPGRAAMWLRAPHAVVAGEESSATARFLTGVDAANGIAVRVAPHEAAFPNVDLGVHLLREPVSGWVGLDTDVTFTAQGTGLTSSALHDEAGYLGQVAQALTVRPFPTA
ncbi:thioesterase family protein [Kocuria sp. LUK]|uniref:thioesterase family protein n=1 Tax=Kocuria sp. LUK TaxID=2897828 RepID=UPI001E454C8E|nr:thioesterase family protein [Kocuria sp. LUK]MCD1145464.1 thioesterase family protein [Kocuria sp. LUK]